MRAIDRCDSGTKSGADEERLRDLVEHAVAEIAQRLAALPLRDGGIVTYGQFPPLPNIRSPDLESFDLDAMRKKASVTQLLSYLKLLRPKKNGGQSWNHDVFYWNLYWPLLRIGQDRGIRTGSGGWKTHPDDLARLVDAVTALALGHGRALRIIVPVYGLRLEGFDDYDLFEHVRIRRWSEEDYHVFLDRHGRHYSWRDHAAPTRAYVEILSTSKDVCKTDLGSAQLEDYVSTTMSKVKWAIMQASTTSCCVSELPFAIEDDLNSIQILPVLRGRLKFPPEPDVLISKKEMEEARRLLDLLHEAIPQFRNDLTTILSIFDRATLAVLPRDVLFEATVGLERILVADNREIRYRFAKQGAALLYGEDAATASRFLRDIYDKRSGTVHGRISDTGSSDLHLRARSYLAGAITSVVHLIVAEHVVPDKQASLLESIERYLLEIFYEASRTKFQSLQLDLPRA